MKCPHCHTFVSKIPISWKCPRCGEKLPEPGKLYYLKEHIIEYLNEKGVVFWSIWFAIALVVIGVLEMVMGQGFLLRYMSGTMLVAIVFIFFGGMLIDMYMKINLPLRSMSGSDFIVRERVVIRNIRKATNLAALIGLVFCVYWLKPRLFFVYFPSYIVVMSCFLAFSWAVVGLFLDARMAEDVRFRLFLDRLGVMSLKRYRKLGTMTIGLLVVTVVGFNVLISIPGLWSKISDMAIIGAIIFFVSEYLAWLI